MYFCKDIDWMFKKKNREILFVIEHTNFDTFDNLNLLINDYS